MPRPLQPDTAIGRPKFSLFKASSKLILDKLTEMRDDGPGEPPFASCIVYRRGEIEAETTTADPHGDVCRNRDRDDAVDALLGLSSSIPGGSGGGANSHCFDGNGRHADGNADDAEDSATLGRRRRLSQRRRPQTPRRRPVGFDLDADPVPVSDLAGYRVRSGDFHRLTPPGASCPCSPDHMRLQRQDSSGLPLLMYRNKRDSYGGLLSMTGRISGIWGREHRSPPPPPPTVEEEKKSGKATSAAVPEEWCKEDREAGMRDSEEAAEAFITGVYFPLLSVLMPKWLEQVMCDVV